MAAPLAHAPNGALRPRCARAPHGALSPRCARAPQRALSPRCARARQRALRPGLPRSRRALRIALVVACLWPWPLLAHGQAPEPVAPILTPPALHTDAAPHLPELPPGSEPATVVLELTVDMQGHARDPIVLSSAGDELDRAA